MADDRELMEYLDEAVDAWRRAVEICPDRDKKADEQDPGNAPHCSNEDNQSCMGWCEPGSCPRAGF